MFYKGAMDKLGVEAQLIRHGEYKSAMEPFINENMSTESREQILTWMGSIWKHTLKKIGDARGLDPERLDQIAEDALIRSASHALENQLVDELLYKDQVIDELKKRTETPEQKDLQSIRLKSYKKVG